MAALQPVLHVRGLRGNELACALNDVSDFHMQSVRGFADISIDGTVFRLKI